MNLEDEKSWSFFMPQVKLSLLAGILLQQPPAFAEPPRDKFTFKLTFDLYDSTVPPSPSAPPPRTSGRLFARLPSHFDQNGTALITISTRNIGD